MFVVCCVGNGLCDEQITRSEGSTERACLNVCYLETSTMNRPRLSWAVALQTKQIYCLFHDAVNRSDFKTSNYMTISEQRTGYEQE